VKVFQLLLSLNVLILLSARAQDCSFSSSQNSSITLFSDQIMDITESFASEENIKTKEDRVIKISIQKTVPLNKNIDLQKLSQDEKLLKAGLDKKTTLTKLSKNKFSGQRNIFGVTITFDSEVSNLSQNTLHLANRNYSHVFIKSDTYLTKYESKVEISSTIYLKQSSFLKLQKMTFGNAVSFVKRKIEDQLNDVSAYIIEASSL